MSTRLETLVIATSLTEASDGIVRTGAAVARATGASPWLVHAYMPPAYSTEPLEARRLARQAEARALREGLIRQAHRTGLDRLAGFQPDQLLPVIGSPPQEIVAVARRVKADLVVAGAAEVGSLPRLLLGSTADGVIRRAPCPVLVVRPETAFPPARVEIAVDLSPASVTALRAGLSFLAALGVPLAQTEALFVLSPFEVGGAIHFGTAQVERFAREELCRFLRAISPSAVPRLSRVRTGHPREEILHVLKERQADFAILGTHGRTGFERLTLGSVAAEVMHQSTCNLLVVPPAASLRAESAAGEEERRTGADWEFVSDEIPAAVT